MKDLHIFFDDHGHYLEKMYERLGAGREEQALFVNISDVYRANEQTTIVALPARAPQVLAQISALHGPQRVFFHPFHRAWGPFLLDRLREKWRDSRKIWVFWSYELYGLPAFSANAYEPFSAHFTWRRRVAGRFARFFTEAIRAASGRPFYRLSHFQHAVGQLDEMRSFLRADYEATRRLLGVAPRRHAYMSYLSLSQMIPAGLATPGASADWIMLNHAAAPEGNHMEILERLARMGGAQKVLIPLAYGSAAYGARIQAAAERLLKERAVVLSEFMPAANYFQTLQQVQYAVFNHKIQQGLGNLLGLLANGCKVFLRAESPAYKEFLSWGLRVYDIADLNAQALYTPLKPDEAAHNRKLLEERFSEAAVGDLWR